LTNITVSPSVQRAVFAATSDVSCIIHAPALYRDPWVVHDIITYPAAAIATAYLAPYKWDDNDTERFNALRIMDRDRFTSLLTFPWDEYAWDTTHPADVNENDLIAYLRNWRGLFSLTGHPYTSLNRTLMNLPRVPAGLLPYLARVHLERPMTQQLELLLLLTHSATAYGDAWQRHLHTYMHATANQIHEAMRQVAVHTWNELRPTLPRDMELLIGFLNDYPQPHHGTIIGLAKKSIAWHRHARAHGRIQGEAASAATTQRPHLQSHYQSPLALGF
jgi:hypothetical protein